MEDKESILQQKIIAKENIDNSEYFMLITNKMTTGCATMVETFELLVNGIRALVEHNNFPKFLLNHMVELIKADDINECLANKIKELESEEE